MIGIFGALQASGFAISVDPSTMGKLVINFVRGVPHETELKVFMADRPAGGSVCHDWCWQVNFLSSKSSAEAWTKANRITGSLISVANLMAAAGQAWSRHVTQRKN